MDITVPHWRDVPVTLGTDGLWHAKVTVGRKPNGTLDRRHRSGHTEAEVRAKLKELLRKVDKGEKPQVGKAPTVEQWFTTWLTTIATVGAKKLKPKTLEGYWSICRIWIFPHLGGLRVDALETEDLERLYAAMYARKVNGKLRALGESTVLKAHAIMRRGLEIALRRGKVTRNVAKLMDPPGAPTVARESLSRDAIKAVLEVARGRRNGARWYLGLAIGPRQGETLGLRWSDLDLVEETVAIQWQLQRLGWKHGCDDPHACGALSGDERARLAGRKAYRPGQKKEGLHHFQACPKGCTRHRSYKRGCPKPCRPGCTKHESSCPQRAEGGLQFTRPKGWRRRPRPRVVALPAGVAQLLREQRAAQAAERLHAGTWWKDHDLVFAHLDGRPIDPRVDWGMWKELLVEAGVPSARVHVMRHSTATALLDMGEDISIIQEVLGHADIRTTRGYQDVTPELTRRAASKMDGLLGTAAVTDLVTERERRRSS